MRISIDISNNYHKSYAIVSNYEGFDIKQEKWQLTLGRKCITDLLSIVKKFPDAEQVIFSFDAKNENFRKALNKTYKANRTKKEQEFYDLLDEIYNIFLHKGYNAIRIEGLEADDILALSRESAKNMFCVLVSNDEDIRQLVNCRTVVFTANTNNYKLYCDTLNTVAKNIPEMVPAAQSINPDLILFEKLLLGCQGDNVERLLPKGHGPQKVKKIYELVYNDEYDLENALKQCGYDITYELIRNQYNLVGLSSIHMPDKLVEQFYQIEINSKKVDTEMKTLLSNTRFITR